MLDGVAGGSGAVGDVELAVDRAHMVIDGEGTEGELFCDLRVGQPLCHQIQYLDLSRRQSTGIGR